MTTSTLQKMIEFAAHQRGARAGGGVMKFKMVLRADPPNRLFRLFRLVWHYGVPGDGKGYSSKFSVALAPRLFLFVGDSSGWICTVLGVRLHYARSWSGSFV